MFTVQVVSPERVSYTGEAAMVVARTADGGDIAFQPGHIPFLGTLAVWSVEVVREDGSRDAFAVHRGFVQVSGDTVTILSDMSEAADAIDVPRARAALERAQAAVAADPSDEQAKLERQQALVRLRVAGADAG